MLVSGLTGRYEPDAAQPDQEVVPHRDITGWRGQCECGWQGEFWKRVDSPDQADLGRRLAYLPPETSGHAPEPVEDAICEEWEAHILPLAGIAGVTAAAREFAQAAQRLDNTVAVARAAGASWADTGRAAGITRQAAHERWAGK